MDRVFEFNSNIFLDDRRFERARHCEIFWNSTPSTQICLFGPANPASGRCRALAAAREFNSSTQGRYKQARFGRFVEVIDESPCRTVEHWQTEAQRGRVASGGFVRCILLEDMLQN